MNISCKNQFSIIF